LYISATPISSALVISNKAIPELYIYSILDTKSFVIHKISGNLSHSGHYPKINVTCYKKIFIIIAI
jgi:hypothetical protein